MNDLMSNVKISLDIVQMYTLLLFVVGVTYVAYVRTKTPNEFVIVLAYAMLFAAACAPVLGRVFKIL